MKLRIATLAAAAALAAVPTLAQMGPHGHGPGGPGGPPSILHLADELGLTTEQTTRIKTIEAKYRDGELGTAMDAMREAHQALGRAIHDLAATDETVTQAADAVATLERQLAVLRHHLVVEVAAVLTEEQRTQLAAMHPGPGRGGRRGR